MDQNAEEDHDRAEDYQCLSCKKPYDSKRDRVPYMLPCQHNVCDSCIVEGDEGKGQEFTCPKDYTTISGLINAERNNALFMKVKLRERKFAL